MIRLQQRAPINGRRHNISVSTAGGLGAQLRAGLTGFKIYPAIGGGVTAEPSDVPTLGKFKAVQRAHNAYVTKFGAPRGSSKLCVDGSLGPATVRQIAITIEHAKSLRPIAIDKPVDVPDLANNVDDYTTMISSFTSIAPDYTPSEVANDRLACPGGAPAPQIPDSMLPKKGISKAGLGLMALLLGAIWYSARKDEAGFGSLG